MRTPIRPDCLVIGGCNSDVIGSAYAGHDAAIGDSNSWPGEISQAPGGVARNIAEALSRLGQSVYFAGRYGDDAAGSMIAESLTKVGVSLQLSEQLAGQNSDQYLSVFDAAGGWRGAIADMALVQGMTPQWLAPVIAQAPADATLIFDTNLSEESVHYLCHVDDRRFLACDGVSPAKVTKLRPVLSALTCLKVTRDEAETLLQLPTGATCEEMIARLHEAGVSVVALSDGPAGFHLSDGADHIHMLPPAIDIISVSGAGDCLFAGILWGLCEGDDLATIAQKGQFSAAASLTSKAAVPSDLSPAAFNGVTI